MTTSRASARLVDVPLLAGFVTFLLTDAIPGGVSGLEGFLIGAVATVLLLVLLVFLAVVQSVRTDSSASRV